MTRIAMLAGLFILLLGPPKSDRLKDRGQTEQQHSLFFLFAFFSPLLSYYPSLLFLLFSVLYLSVYNLFALIGRKAPFTHSLMIGRKAPFTHSLMIGRKAPFTHSLMIG